MTMFTVLLRLRQVCCDLRMTGVNEDAIKSLSTDDLSGKLTVWHDRLEEIITAGGKVIVFSQFVKFLHLLRGELEKEGHDFCYLDGQSNDRGAQVERFQKDAKCKVFLISLKAGGYGLNLTAADHVMLMDLKLPLQKDTTIPLTLVFKDAKGVESKMELKVPVAQTAPGGGADMGGHQHGDMGKKPKQ
jgi:SNF2 family DNA or RNA helicase